MRKLECSAEFSNTTVATYLDAHRRTSGIWTLIVYTI